MKFVYLGLALCLIILVEIQQVTSGLKCNVCRIDSKEHPCEIYINDRHLLDCTHIPEDLLTRSLLWNDLGNLTAVPLLQANPSTPWLCGTLSNNTGYIIDRGCVLDKPAFAVLGEGNRTGCKIDRKNDPWTARRSYCNSDGCNNGYQYACAPKIKCYTCPFNGSRNCDAKPSSESLMGCEYNEVCSKIHKPHHLRGRGRVSSRGCYPGSEADKDFINKEITKCVENKNKDQYACYCWTDSCNGSEGLTGWKFGSLGLAILTTLITITI